MQCRIHTRLKIMCVLYVSSGLHRKQVFSCVMTFDVLLQEKIPERVFTLSLDRGEMGLFIIYEPPYKLPDRSRRFAVGTSSHPLSLSLSLPRTHSLPTTS